MVSRRRRPAILAGVAVVVIAGIIIGLLAGSAGGGHSNQTIAGYLRGHVPSGTPIGVMGPVRYEVPTAYPTVPIDASNLGSAAAVRYALAPDPLASAGPVITSYVLGHATLVLVDHGRATLWKLQKGAPAGPAPNSVVTPVPNSVAATVVPSSVAPTTTVPTSAQAPPTENPGQSGSPGAGATPPSPVGAVTVQPGQSFWTIAAAEVQHRTGGTPTTAQIAHYWVSLVAANRHNLPVPGNPNLIYSGATVVLPAR